ncbi:hypothetical protein PVAP13_8KG257100 [Panicum virgatum]|uniref:RING-type domain-containing protein n=1 Tax=Panicum virgatum TaxID=38727 RepID=A0A8T0PJ41_PANVG|nr:hypothetical protein PVAP13_8KG257100 [Panicum virgatum]
MSLQGIKMIPASAGEPAVVAGSAVPPAAAGDVLGAGVAIDPPALGPEREEESAVLGEQEDDGLTDDEDFSGDEDDITGDEDDGVDSSDSEFEEDGQPLDVVERGAAAAAAPNVVLMATMGFLGRPTRAASFQNTTGFMRLVTAEAVPGKGGGGGREILVHYRYTRFSRARSGGDDAVDMHVLGPKLARVRFHLPSHAADPASSLRLAGAALAPLVYPSRFSAQLRALWSCLVALAPVRAPPRGARIVVAVDVGILRPGDRTPERMRSVRAALECLARERDSGAPPAAAFGSTELHLPAPLAAEDDARPAKRRRVTGEDCPICCEALDRGLAAWPRCAHIFHGRCLEEHLVRGHQECPMCRSELNVNAIQ